ncbi:hypothetical protein [Streptomyces sp. NPDC002537]
MAAQIKHLIHAAALPNVTTQVMSTAKGGPPGHGRDVRAAAVSAEPVRTRHSYSGRWPMRSAGQPGLDCIGGPRRAAGCVHVLLHGA